jgi:FkbM family methyltransferase
MIKLNYDEVRQISFVDENQQVININQIETVEQKQAWDYVPVNATVLELGARYGTVSCLINHKIVNPCRQVSVEPDPVVISALKKNKESHHCQFTIFEGVISKIPMNLNQDSYNGYGNFCTPCDIPNLKTTTLEQLMIDTGLTFDTLVADCEGFLEQFIFENENYISNFKVIMFERDYPYRCNYPKIENLLRQLGFQCVNAVGDMHVVYSKL